MPNPMSDRTNAAQGRQRGSAGSSTYSCSTVHVGHRPAPGQLSFMATAALCVPGAEHTAAGWFPVMAQIDAVR